MIKTLLHFNFLGGKLHPDLNIGTQGAKAYSKSAKTVEQRSLVFKALFESYFVDFAQALAHWPC